MKKDNGLTAQATGLSLIGCADVVKKHTRTPWEAQWPDNEADYPDRGAAFIIGAPFEGLVGAALPLPTELDSGDFSRVWANAKFIVKCVNCHGALVNALKEMIAAIDANSIDSEMLPGEPEVGIHPHKWHDEWAFYVRAILASLHREAIAEKPCFEGVDTPTPSEDIP
jgi:hypothetical protein